MWRLTVLLCLAGCRPDPNEKCATLQLGTNVSTLRTQPALADPGHHVDKMLKGPVTEARCCLATPASCSADCTAFDGARIVELVDYGFDFEPVTGNQDSVLRCTAIVKDDVIIALHSFTQG